MLRNKLSSMILIGSFVGVSCLIAFMLYRQDLELLTKSPWETSNLWLPFVMLIVPFMLWLLPGNEVYRSRLSIFRNAPYARWLVTILVVCIIYLLGVGIYAELTSDKIAKALDWANLINLTTCLLVFVSYMAYLRLKGVRHEG